MAPKKQSKWRLILRAVLLTGNVVAFVLLVQDAAQQFSSEYGSDDDRPGDAMMRNHHRQRVGGGTGTGTKQLHRPRSLAGKKFVKRKEILREDAILPAHPMMKGEKQNRNMRKQTATAGTSRAAGDGNNDDEALANPPPNFTHYFIHIPKAGGTYARHQLNTDMRENRLIGKRGILCDRGISPVSKYKSWPSFFDFNSVRHNMTAMAEVARTLGEGEEVPVIKNKIRRKCGLYMTESHYSSIPQHVYTIVRDPREHVVSAYFHCKESKLHGKKFGHLMPDTLDEWLNVWTSAKRAPQGPQKARAMEETARFRCYNPINMQSTMLLSPSEGGEVAEISKAGLARRYDVIGLTSQMDKSLCLVFIAWNGFAPDRCVCGGGFDDENEAQGNQSLTHVVAIHSHNVTNHGGTHEHTPEQLSAIEELANVDVKLYSVAEQLFEDQVAEVEKKYSIKLC